MFLKFLKVKKKVKMHFIVVGTNFKTADVVNREKFHFSKESLPEALANLNKRKSIQGSVILSTCNRVEIYASVDNVDNGFNDIINFMSSYHNIPPDDINPLVYKKNCHEAVFHLLKVASSLDSMVIGEYEIQGQVRDSYNYAQENNATNGLLNKLFQAAIQTGKKVRSETKIGEGTVSVANMALDITKKYYGSKDCFNLLIIGAGKMASLTASNFRNHFANCNVCVTNRTQSNAIAFAQKYFSDVIDYENRYNEIANSDVIVVSTSSENYVVSSQELSQLVNGNKTKKRLFIDLSIPRNIAPGIGEIPNCKLFSIDDINKIIETNLGRRAEEIESAHKIINEVAEEYFEWYMKQSIMPTMMAIKNQMGIIKDRTIASYDSFYKNLEEKQATTVSEMLDSYADKIIRVIMKNIRRAATKEELISITNTLKDTLTLDINNE
ncbi:MAG: glutamyl-tRNA reductase [Ignavibacteria bacterium]|nr:glutamyl-tRNA reductase [Ignavibacteria bacterium]